MLKLGKFAEIYVFCHEIGFQCKLRFVTDREIES
jgi:hypothetical protein